MLNRKKSEKYRKASHLRLLLPCLLMAVLVLDGLLGYTMPDPFDGVDVVNQKAHAAEAPELEELPQTAERQVSKGPAEKLSTIEEPDEYKDGVYTGSANGFGGTIKVKVTVSGGKIKSIEIVSASGETDSYFSRAKAVIGKILKKQSTNVDAVSGATYSSNGIIKAVRDALSKAGKSKESGKKKDQKKAKPHKSSKKKPVKPESVSSGKWKDGTYTGEGEGFGGKLHVKVTIKDGKIAAIELVDDMDGKDYISKAQKGIFPSVIKKQGTDVDAVTGATYSSYGLIEAINDALKKAVKSDDTQPAEDPKEDEGEFGGDVPDEPATETLTGTGWVYYDEDEDFEDYQLTVTFTLKDGVVTEISDYSQDGNPSNNSYIRSAVRGINDQLSRGIQAENVDSVTGATCTSTAIKEMIAGISAEKVPETPAP